MTDHALRQRIVQAIIYADELPFVYIQNPKVACTTIKASLWEYIDTMRGKVTFVGNAHDRRASPFVNVFNGNYDFSSFSGKPFVTMVRNPFSRAVSAYSDKIGNVRSNHAWENFCRIHDIDPTLTKRDYSFLDFLRTLASSPDTTTWDQHFRPQYLDILYHSTEFAFIGRLESAQDTFAYMTSAGVPIENRVLGASRIKTPTVQYYNDEAIHLVRTIYAEDFRLFGYSTELSEMREFGEMVPPERPDEVINIIRGSVEVAQPA
ncbi:sulfotransferase family 2 domain-containing protein [Propylenella binzhouense]|uniref:Sulfotransferase family protein n=1 Tax=Propylenella binzhouense TaxID=2555902 RepID=A0A964WSY2_9HYPH|nr:sulfotransferase family 2 domain-containing protein [Propylenella binzhouense]MYZ47449.1 hypothetical protein [Propylenella binzhouense]